MGLAHCSSAELDWPIAKSWQQKRLSSSVSRPVPSEATTLVTATATPLRTTATATPLAATATKRGKPSPLTAPPLLTTPLVVMDTTSTDLATLTLTGAPRVFVSTRGLPSLELSLLSVEVFLVPALPVPTSPSTVTSTTGTASGT